jgi:hypothetical protein
MAVMSDRPGTLELIGTHLTLALRPLSDGLSDLAHFKQLMYRLGWKVTGVPPEYTSLAAAVAAAVNKLEGLGANPSPDDIAGLLQAVKSAYQAIQGITTAPPGVDAGTFLAEIGERLFELLLTDYLSLELPTVYNLLKVLNVIQLEHAKATSGRPSAVRTHFRWSEIPSIISQPQDLPKLVYGWGTADLNVQRIVDHLAELFFAIGLPVQVQTPDVGLAVEYASLADQPFPDVAKSLAIPFWSGTIANQQLRAAFVLRELPAAGSELPGLVLEPQIPSQFPLTFPLTDTITLRVLPGTNAGSLFGILMKPDGVSIKYPFQPGKTPPQASIGVGMDFKPTTAVILVGDTDATRLELQGTSLDFTASFVNDQFELDLTAQLTGLALVLRAGDGDSFIQSVVGDGETRIDIPLGVQWSSRHGVSFNGSSSFEVELQPHFTLGPISIDDVTVSLAVPSPRPPDIVLAVGAAISGKLGPVQFAVQGIGLKLATTFSSGNVGPFDIGLGFMPPNGVGLAVDAAGVTGGGFLGHDDAKHEYDGVLQLQFINLALQAFGLITTQVAGGSGYSLLALIDAEFPPIQLGWGFTLEGVGGLFAVHRTASTDALHAALKAGQLSSILFPKNAITNAPVILAQLDAMFPTAPGRFLFGPMALIGWGTPRMLKASIGVVVELPEPVRVILLSRIEARLPNELKPVVRVNMDVLGVLDLGKNELSFDGILFDSKIIDYTLSGTMALRAAWGSPDHREFVLAIGGVHPRFTPPPDFPQLQRITIDMPSGPISKLRLAAYMAVTANAIQFGANLDVFLGASGFSVSGHLGFDALLQIIPFRFDSDIAGKVAITAGGDDIASVDLEGTLSGPKPYHIAGQFKVHIVFFDVGVSFDYSWGGDLLDLLAPAINVADLLETALADVRNWDALLPQGISPLVTVRQIDNAAILLAHPLARPGVHQSVVPLGLTITRFGEGVPSGDNTFTITGLRMGTGTIPHDATQDDFAPAQFFELTDDEKLERPSFERHDAGLRVKPGDVTSGAPVPKTAAYETFYVDTPGGSLREDPGVPLTPPGLGDLSVVLQFGSAGRAATRNNRGRYQVPGNPIRVAEPAFVLADKTTMAAAGIGPAAGATFSEMHALLAGNRALQILATHEMTVN